MGSKAKFWCKRVGTEERYLLKYPRTNTGEDWAEKIAAELAGSRGLRLPHARVDFAMFERSTCCAWHPSIVARPCARGRADGSLDAISLSELVERVPPTIMSTRGEGVHAVSARDNSIGFKRRLAEYESGTDPLRWMAGPGRPAVVCRRPTGQVHGGEWGA